MKVIEIILFDVFLDDLIDLIDFDDL